MNPAPLTHAEHGPVAGGPVSRATRASLSHPLIRFGPTLPDELEALLVPEALAFLAELEIRFGPRRLALLRQRGGVRERWRRGLAPGFLPETAVCRSSDWAVVAPPSDLRDRRVEITGPTQRRMMIHALNSGASVYMADFEDAHSPTWEGTIRGQANLRDAVRRRLEDLDPDGGSLRLHARTATLMVRPRGWHLTEDHMTVEGFPISASLFDFGLFAFHNAEELLRRGSGPYLYLPKIEHHEEARLWNDVFEATEAALVLPTGSIRAAVLIETFPAVFQMDEILYALRERSLGLNSGRWDYLFSFIKQFRDDPRFVLPDRRALTMETPFLDAYARALVATCHRREAYAIGGMAADVPVKADPDRNAAALSRVRADKEREVSIGYDGTWVAHPALVEVARQAFDGTMRGDHQIDRKLALPPDLATELLRVPSGRVTEAGIRSNVRATLAYLSAWLNGSGAVAIDGRMEDAATVEISRAQLWQWVRYGVPLADGPRVTVALFRALVDEESIRLSAAEPTGERPRESLRRAREIIDAVVVDPEFVDFVTLAAYPALRLLEGS